MTDWKPKLAAYLHDPPSKALDIRTHGERSDAAFAQAGFSDTEIGEYFAHADHTAAAMDRLPFPKSSAGLQCAFDGIRNGFLHPLSGEKLPIHAEFKSVEQGFEGESSVQAVVDMATSQMPADHRDGRYYVGGKDGPKKQLNNLGLGWSVILALNNWQLDAVRQTRSFDAANTGGWQTGTFNNKDVLTGRDEAVAGGTVWTDRTAAMVGAWKSLFKHGDWLGAATLMKRVWHLAYLGKAPWNLATNSKSFPMPNTRSLAAHEPFGRDDDFDNEKAEESDSSEKYFAVLAFDGDEIGKWVSGEKTPPFSSQLADYKDGSNIQRFGAKPYFEQSNFKEFLEAQRPLSPSYHFQFSEALSNFALLCARPIVEAFDGRLIYAGGDDVVALLPADTALVCAEALRAAFTGREDKGRNGNVLFRSPAPGFLSSDDWKDDHDRGRPIPFLVPGPAADCSVGIAIAHFKAPLQDVVRAPQLAEKRAKRQLGRSAVAVTLFKRSGETIEWGCNWESRGLGAFHAMLVGIKDGIVSAKFPRRIVELVDGYKTGASGKLGGTKPADGFDTVAREILAHEIATATERQRGPKYSREGAEKIRDAVLAYLDSPSPTAGHGKVNALIGLCQTVAFAHRTASEDEP